jgi:VWFA-related protein
MTPITGKKRNTAMTGMILALGTALLGGGLAGAQSQSTAPPAQPAAQQGTAPQQGTPPIPETRTRIISRTDTVIVPVTVKDGQGRIVAGLERDEFRVFADNVEQQIVFFDPNPFPLSAVVLIDNDLSDRSVQQVQKSLVAISAGFGPNDEVALVTYDEFPETVADFSTNNDELFTKLKRLELGTHSSAIVADPTTAGPVINGQPLPNGQGVPVHGSGRPANNRDLDDALYAAGQMLKPRGRERRKIIFLISDGTNSHHNQHTFDETLHTLWAADVSVYSISVSHSVPVGRGLLQHGVAELDKYSSKTGGDTFYAAKQRDLERLYATVTEQARDEYTLTFSPQGAERTHDFHTIEVRVRRPGLTVLARESYYQAGNGPVQ